MELIDKNELHNTLLFMESMEDLSYGKKIYGKVIQQVVNMATVEAEPIRHGHWIADEETGDLRCSVCGHYTGEIEGHWGEVDEELAEVLGVPVGTRYHASGSPSYCSRCGSRMDGGENG